MADRERKVFTHRELAEVLVKAADIHEGHWAVFIEFGLGGANLPIGDSDGRLEVKPAAIVPVNKIGIQKHDEPMPLTVDAALVNPDVSAARQGKRKRAIEVPD